MNARDGSTSAGAILSPAQAAFYIEVGFQHPAHFEFYSPHEPVEAICRFQSWIILGKMAAADIGGGPSNRRLEARKRGRLRIFRTTTI